MNGLLINEPPLQVLPSLAKAIGLNEAIILQQLHYWLRRSSHKHDGHTWIYNTYEGWQEQFPFWSVSTIRRALATLKDKHLIMATDKYNKRAFDNTLWFTIDYPVLSSVHNEIPSAQNEQTMCSEWTDDLLNMNSAIPETTTETTTLKTSLPSAKAPKKPKPVVEAHPNTKPIMDAYIEALGYQPGNYGQETAAAKQLAKQGYQPADIAAAYALLKAEPFWQSKHLSLQTLVKEIPALQQAHLGGKGKVKKGVNGYFDMLAEQGIELWPTK